ncbi:hypothetical protein BDF14DRAFT_1877738 [Spinellus fusiger]|nr:hypothetical protein BDF14DRAFT_1877738 [Spinellus fusiger]
MTTTAAERYGRLPTLELPSFLEFLKLKNFPLKTYPAVYQPPRLQKDTLYIYGPGWNDSWGSFDVECLQLQIYLKICNIDFDIVNSNEPDASPSGALPFLATVTGSVLHGQQIHTWISENDKARSLSGKEAEEAKAFITLANTKLKAALLYFQWLEPVNYTRVTSKAYFGHTPAPIHSILAYQKQQKTTQYLLADHDTLVREEIYSDALHALEALSIQLGDNDYFFNASEPTWVDAVVFAYLHIILGSPQANDSSITEEEKRQAKILPMQIRHYKNLVAYAKRIHKNFSL